MSEPLKQLFFNKELCIICQTELKNVSVTTTENGRNRVRDAAQVREDLVLCRLSYISNEDVFYYHMTNKCYKSYTHKVKIDKLISENLAKNKNSPTLAPATSSNVRKSKRYSEEYQINTDRCIICDNITCKNDKILHVLQSSKRAENLYKASRHFEDDVFTKTANLCEAKLLIDLKVKYHLSCLRCYELKFENSTKPSETTTDQDKSLEINSVILDCIKSIEPRIMAGEILSLKDVSQLIIDKSGPNFSIKYDKIKSRLVHYFGDKICFIQPNEKNKPQIFHFYNQSAAVKDYYYKNSTSECAKAVVESLKTTDFKLEDKFCDDNDLKAAWQTLSVPEPMAEFFSEVFNCDKNVLLKPESEFSLFDKKCSVTRVKKLRLKTLFQIFYFVKNNGFKKTPLHVLIGLFVYANTKSKMTITGLNRLGLSISYDEVLRIRTRLATYTINSCQSIVPLPCHFDARNHVTAAFDNIDHNESTVSGLDSMHDTAFVIFQDFSKNSKGTKPNISDSFVDKRARSFTSTLKCQEVKNFVKSTNTIELPSNYPLNVNHVMLTTQAYENGLNLKDYIWNLCRMKISNRDQNFSLDSDNEQQVPPWISFYSVITEDVQPIQVIGFLPIIPSPVTEYSTVYTSLCNFKDLLSQLNQTHLAVTCDEGVYRIARHIKLQREKEFENIVICLGNFHIIKVFLGCIGKYLKNSGVESIFIETGLFGICVTDQVLNGTHYARSVKAFSYLSEALRRLQIKEFFTSDKLIQYEHQIITLKMLKDSFQEKNFDEIKKTLSDYESSFHDLLVDFHKFIASRCKESEMFAYWNNVLILIDLMHDLIRADRTGDWNLHLETVYKLQPLFHVFDRVNYSRWCNVYLEDMQTLQSYAPEILEEFRKGRFTVKQSNISCTSVATDQALEQTINKSSKGSGGIIGSTKKKETVAVWDITFHELMAISNYFREITFIDNENDFEIHHEYSNASIQISQSAVDTIVEYIITKEINPFQSGKQQLRNLVTEQLVHPDITKDILSIFEKGINLYENFREERFVKKTKLISAVIPRNNLPDFKTSPKTENTKKSKKKVTVNDTQRIIERINNERNYPLELLLQYDLTYKNLLFDDDGFLKKENNKSLLSRELEKILCGEPNEELSNNQEMGLFIDVMLVLRKISWKGMTTFGDLAKKFNQIIKNKASSLIILRIDFIFDSYFDRSIKSSEHERRRKSDSIKYNNITKSTILPKQEDKFWGCPENKVLLQMFLKESIVNEDMFSNYKLICSTINDDACSSNVPTAEQTFLKSLQRFDIEEADLKIIIHLHNFIHEGYKHGFIISSDTDVMVLALYFFKTFEQRGLQTLWIEVGTSNSKRNVPLHQLAALHGEELCSILPALHHLTGSEYTSKIGTKLSALQVDPTKYLLQFGTSNLETAIDCDIKNAEQFLVQVLKKNSKCKTFNELRLYSFHHAKHSLIEDLPPTTRSIRLHILRAYYIVYTQTKCLDKCVPLDPTQYGFIVQDDLLLPEKVQVLLPSTDELTPNCLCKVCSRKTCICVASQIVCCKFCACHQNNTCKNVYNDTLLEE